MPRVRVLFFAQYAEAVGRDEATIAVQEAATVKDVIASVREQLAGGVDLPAQPLAALNAAHTPLDARVRDGDEVALLPPLAGG